MRKIIDAHTHIYQMPEGIKKLIAVADKFGYEKINILSVPPYLTILQNIEVALCKKLYPERVYAFAGLEYETESMQPDGRTFLSQAKRAIEMGFDGFKLIEGKPGIRKMVNRRLDAPCYDKFYSFLEQNNLPVLMHIADPRDFWNRTTAPKWAVDAGFCYDKGGFLPYQCFYEEVDGVLQKHPRLRLIIAHFYFLSDNLQAAADFLDKWENVAFDITAGTEMYVNFTKDYAAWKAFFIKYQDRIIFGTDSADVYTEKEESISNILNNMEIDFLSRTGKIEAWELDINGMAFSETIQKKIFAENFLRYVGNEPNHLNDKAVLDEIGYLKGIITDKLLLDKLLCYKKYFL